MIVRDQPPALHLIWVLRGSILSRIYLKILFFALWAGLVEFAALSTGRVPSPSLASMGVFGVALTLFLAFRNTAVFDRWWEARKLWGGIVASVRAACQDSLIHLTTTEDRRSLLLALGCFFHAHRTALRALPQTDMPAYLDGQTLPKNSAQDATAWLRLAAARLNQIAAGGRVDPMGRLALSTRLSELAAFQAGNERIKTTPVPFVFSLLVRRTTYVYCVLLPFALAHSGGLLAPAIMAVVAYVFFGLQAVTNELEDPFTMDSNGLALDAICRVCDNAVLETLGENPLPQKEPVDFVLM